MSRARDRIWDSHARKCDGDDIKISFIALRYGLGNFESVKSSK